MISLLLFFVTSKVLAAKRCNERHTLSPQVNALRADFFPPSRV